MHRINVCLKLWKAHASLALFKISLLNQWSKLGMFKQMLRFLAAVVKLYDFEEGGIICLVVCYNSMILRSLWIFINVSQGIRRKNVNNWQTDLMSKLDKVTSQKKSKLKQVFIMIAKTLKNLSYLLKNY